MYGDLSIAAQPAARDLAASTGGARAPVVRQSGETAVASHTTGVPDASQQLEAARLKEMLTDPAMRISTHHDKASGHIVLQVHRHATGEVVEQIPSDKLLRLYASLREPLVDECA